MAGPAAVAVAVDVALETRIVRLARAGNAPAKLARRAGIIALAVTGLSNAEIARRVGADVKTVRTWRRRFAEAPRLGSLGDRRRSGRPPHVAPEVRAKLISLACSRTDEQEHVAFRDLWTRGALQAALLIETGVKLSCSEIGRILSAEEIRPHLVRMWLKSQDPDFDAKAKRICALYVDPPEGVTVLCIDEKRLFAHERLFPTRPARRSKRCQEEFQYRRNGTCALLAAFDIRTGKVFGHCRPTRKAADLVEFMEAVATQVPGRVIVIWDNLNVHYDGVEKRWTEFNRRHGSRFEFVFTPKHASWLNQVEIWFSILERRVLRHGSFPTVDKLTERVLGYIDHWNRHEAHPFRWTFRGSTRRRTPHGLHPSRLLARRRASRPAAPARVHASTRA